MVASITFVNADLGAGRPASLRICGARILSVGDRPSAGDVVIDLHGDRLLPGLINAHDHLHLNTLPPLEPTGYWRHAREWVLQVNVRRRTDPAFESCLAVALNERLLIGGVKNLLAGVTTVVHHDRLYPLLIDPAFPVSVLAGYGWSHSLYVDGEQQVRNSYRRTPPEWPWLIHVAEGIDLEAAGEFDRLEVLRCLGANTRIVHGVAMDRAQRTRLEETGAGLIWCPSSNLRLFGRTAQVQELLQRGRVALGTDSRLTGSRDLLSELKSAREAAALDSGALEMLVTRDAAALLGMADRGALKTRTRADLMVLPAGMRLPDANRADIRLVMLGGHTLYADADYAPAVAPLARWAPVRVDGRAKMLERRLAAALATSNVAEPGLDLAGFNWAAA